MSQTHFMQQEIGFVQIFGCKIDDFSGSGRFKFSLAEDATRVERVFIRLRGNCRHQYSTPTYLRCATRVVCSLKGKRDVK